MLLQSEGGVSSITLVGSGMEIRKRVGIPEEMRKRF